MSRLHQILARDSIHPVYHGGHCVCVGPCLVPPLPTVSNRWSLPISLISGAATLICVKIDSDPCPRFHPPCVSRGTLCVRLCVGVCHCMLTPPPLHPPDVHCPMILLVGGHAYMCQYCVRSLPVTPSTVWITVDTVCVGPCLVPLLPTVFNRWSLPINLISGVATLTCDKIASDPCPRLHRPCVSRGRCVCVCVCV